MPYIGYTIVFLGKPLIFYIGIMTFITFLFAASIAILNRRGIRWIDFKWHPRVAFLGIALGLLHGLLAIMPYLF